MIFDVLWRWLERSGHGVVFARNITDVDDKIIVRAAEEGVPWWQVGRRVIHQMERAYDVLGLRPPTVEPLVTGHITQLVKRWRPVELRYYLVAPHYRSTVEYAEEALDEAAAAYRRIEGFVTRAVEVAGAVPAASDVPAAFRDAMDDDLGTPQALAVVHAAVREGNAALAAGDKEAIDRLLGELRAMLDVLGLDPLAEPWAEQAGAGDGCCYALGKLVDITLEQRQLARACKDYATADALRDGLAAAGVVVEDTRNGPRWSLGR